MKQSHVVLLSVVLSILAATATVKSLVPDSKASRTSASSAAMEHVLKTGTIRCAYATWPPGLLKDPNTGQLSGINYDIMEAIGRELDLKIEWVEEVGFGNFIEGLRTHRYDMMCTSAWPDGPRVRHLLYTMPTYYSPIYAYVRSDDNRFDGNLNRISAPDVKISAIDGDVSATQARLDFPKAGVFSLPQTAEGTEILLSVMSKKADVVFSDKANFAAFDKTNPGKMRAVKNVPPAVIFAEPLVMLPEDVQLHSMVNLAILNLTNNGKIAAILDKYPTGDFLRPGVTYTPEK